MFLFNNFFFSLKGDLSGCSVHEQELVTSSPCDQEDISPELLPDVATDDAELCNGVIMNVNLSVAGMDERRWLVAWDSPCWREF